MEKMERMGPFLTDFHLSVPPATTSPPAAPLVLLARFPSLAHHSDPGVGEDVGQYSLSVLVHQGDVGLSGVNGGPWSEGNQLSL